MLGRRSFTLVELAVTCSIIAILCGCIGLAASPVIAGFLDESGERAVEREVLDAVSWIKSHFHRARALRRDVVLQIPAQFITPIIFFKDDHDSIDNYSLSGELIGFNVISTSAQRVYFVYSHQHLTVTPSVRIRIYKLTAGGYKKTDWIIKVSGRGYVSTERQW
jgi:Tfp pilus assembly protein FimT